MTWRIEVIFGGAVWIERVFILETEGRAGNLTPWKRTSLPCLKIYMEFPTLEEMLTCKAPASFLRHSSHRNEYTLPCWGCHLREASCPQQLNLPVFLLLRLNAWPGFMQKISNSITCDSPWSNPRHWWRLQLKLPIGYRNNPVSQPLLAPSLYRETHIFQHAKYSPNV